MRQKECCLLQHRRSRITAKDEDNKSYTNFLPQRKTVEWPSVRTSDSLFSSSPHNGAASIVLTHNDHEKWVIWSAPDRPSPSDSREAFLRATCRRRVQLLPLPSSPSPFLPPLLLALLQLSSVPPAKSTQLISSSNNWNLDIYQNTNKKIDKVWMNI